MSKRRSISFIKSNSAKKHAPVEGKQTAIDWELCFLCQENSIEKLQCSKLANSSYNPFECYGELSERILKFDQLGALPIPLDIELLMDGHEQLPESLFRHSAKFHKSCKLKFGQVKLDRAIKQSSHSSSPLQSPTSSEALQTNLVGKILSSTHC